MEDMKEYRIIYWFNANIKTEIYIKAKNKQDAIKLFEKQKGNSRIVNVEESEAKRRNMYNISDVSEFERFGFKQDSNLGALNLNIGIHFPWIGQEDLSVNFALLTDKQMFDLEGKIDFEESGFKDIKLNHRYPNHNWVTVSKKKGRSVCKLGYPVIELVETLNDYKWLAIWCTFASTTSVEECLRWTYCFNISAELSKEKPICELEVFFDLRKMCYTLETHEPFIAEDGTKLKRAHRYTTGNIDWHLMGNIEDDAFEDGEKLTLKDGSVLLLPFVGIELENGGEATLYDQEIALPAQTIDDYFYL